MVDLATLKGGSSVGTTGKAPKIKISKDQERYLGELLSLENRIATCRDYIKLWLEFFKHFSENIEDREITGQDEKAFFQTLTKLARQHFLYTELAGETFDGAPDIIDVLCRAISLSHIQAMEGNTRNKLELDWHTLYLNMNKSLGRLVRAWASDEVPLSKALAEIGKIVPIEASSEEVERLAQERKKGDKAD